MAKSPENKIGNNHFNVNFMPLYDMNSRIIDKSLQKAYILMCQQINISIKICHTLYSNLKMIFFINIVLKTD